MTGLISAVTQAGADGAAVTFCVYARYAEAVSERPVPGKFSFAAEVGSAQEKAVEDFLDYGLPVEAANATNMVIDLPGGLGVNTPTEGIVRIGPAHTTAQPVQLRLAVLEADTDDEVAGADLLMQPATKGMRGTSSRRQV